jgi:2-hydroxychromene-2-carboxylate isomerase
MWRCGEQERNMGEDSVIFEVVDKAGLDATGLLAAMQDSDVKARLLENTPAILRTEAPSVRPSFFIGDELFFGKDRLREVEEEIMRQQKQDPKP